MLKGKINFTITPHPVIIDQVYSYFAKKPAELYMQIYNNNSRAPVHMYRFLDHIFALQGLRRYHYREKAVNKFEVRLSTLAFNIHLLKDPKDKIYQTVINKVEKCLAVAQELNIISVWSISELAVEGQYVRYTMEAPENFFRGTNNSHAGHQ